MAFFGLRGAVVFLLVVVVVGRFCGGWFGAWLVRWLVGDFAVSRLVGTFCFVFKGLVNGFLS